WDQRESPAGGDACVQTRDARLVTAPRPAATLAVAQALGCETLMLPCPICAAVLPAASIASPDRGNATPGRFEVAICTRCSAGVSLPLVDPADLAAFYPAGYGPHTQLDRPLVA